MVQSHQKPCRRLLIYSTETLWFKSSSLYNRIIEMKYKDNGPESSKALSFNCRLLIYSIETWFKSSFLYNRIIEIKYKDNDPNHHFSRMFDE